MGLIVLKITDDLMVANVEKTLPLPEDPAKGWKDFLSTLPEFDCRFVVSYFTVQDKPTAAPKSRICVILWVPEYAPVRSKMYVYTICLCMISIQDLRFDAPTRLWQSVPRAEESHPTQRGHREARVGPALV